MLGHNFGHRLGHRLGHRVGCRSAVKCTSTSTPPAPVPSPLDLSQCSESTAAAFRRDFFLLPDFLSPEEQAVAVAVARAKLRRVPFQNAHFDSVISGYRKFSPPKPVVLPRLALRKCQVRVAALYASLMTTP